MELQRAIWLPSDDRPSGGHPSGGRVGSHDPEDVGAQRVSTAVSDQTQPAMGSSWDWRVGPRSIAASANGHEKMRDLMRQFVASTRPKT